MKSSMGFLGVMKV